MAGPEQADVDEPNDPEYLREAFVRWQGITLAQVTYAVNLILGLSVATLGFGVALLLNKDITPKPWQSWTFLFALLSLFVSVGCGIFCVVNRLRDFRATMRAARARQQGQHGRAAQYRELANRLGPKTWVLFWWQISTFGIGVAGTVLAVVSIVLGKLP